MATVDVVGVRATQLGELPGHQINYANVVPRHTNSMNAQTVQTLTRDDITSSSLSTKEESSESSGTRPGSASDIISDLSDSRPKFSVGKDRVLLDNLIKLDEEVFDDVHNITTPDQMYQQWRSGDAGTRKPPVGNNRRQTNTKAPSTRPTNPRKTLLCGWESGKAVQQHNVSDKKPKTRTSCYSKPPADRSNLHDKYYSSASADYKFFHYTDIALYIKQYRKEHSQLSMQSLPANGCREQMFTDQCMRWDSKEMHFPLRLDLSSMVERSQQRHRFSSSWNNGNDTKQDTCSEPIVSGSNYSHPAVLKGNSSTSSDQNISPVILRPPHVPKPPTNQKPSKFFDEPHARLNGTVCKVWKAGGSCEVTDSTPIPGNTDINVKNQDIRQTYALSRTYITLAAPVSVRRIHNRS